MKRLFGTDGIRGLAGEFPLDEKTVCAIGASLTRQFREKLGRDPRFVLGRDTRESGAWIEAAFHTGAGAVCESAEIITTPAVAFLTKAFDFDAGIVISASHNPYHDNGIKIFLPSGRKIDEATERQIESDIDAAVSRPSADQHAPGVSPLPETSVRIDNFRKSYLEHLKHEANGFSVKGLKIVVDCANGASSELAPMLFAGIDANVVVINSSPDGRNINHNCGSLHLEHLRSRVLDERADIGVAFDGDADRALFVDENGKIVDGDATLWIMAGYLRDHGKLANARVVATVMSNIGLEIALKSKGIELLRTNVGDKYVLEKLIETGSEIGGEQSGHIIFPAIGLVGDGMMTALMLLRAICEKGVALSQATDGFTAYPQILLNVEVSEKRPFTEVPAIADAAKQVEAELSGKGRLLLRYSGTENLARVMIEGENQAAIELQADRIAAAIREGLG